MSAALTYRPRCGTDRIPGEEGYLPEGYLFKDAFIRNLKTMVKGVLSDGYDRVWLVGHASVVARKAVDMKTWFTAESEMSELAPRYPQFIMSLLRP